MPNQSSRKNEPKIMDTIWQDMRQRDFRKNLRRDYTDLKDFFLDDDRRLRLSKMNRIKRGFLMTWWLLKSLFFHLTPVRRILFLVALVLIVNSRQTFIIGYNMQTTMDFTMLGALLLLFILMLELKDKLIARSELSEGRAIQNALMPDTSPAIKGWDVWLFSKPANDVGGDLVDYQRLNTRHYGLALADVSGKGLGAALFMVKLQATIRAIAPECKTLDAFAHKLNSIFYRDTISSKFASMVYIRLSSTSSQIQLINAGHFPPLQIKNGEISELAKGDAALGLSTKSSYHEIALNFNEIDTLLVYSDGLSEARNIAGEFFGEQRLIDLLRQYQDISSKSLGERILAAVDQFVGDAKTTDDLSMIIVRRSG